MLQVAPHQDSDIPTGEKKKKLKAQGNKIIREIVGADRFYRNEHIFKIQRITPVI